MVLDDGPTVGDDNGMQCSNHPYLTNNNNNSHGGICAFCLQDKLRKLLSSSSSSPSFTSHPALPLSLSSDSSDQHHHHVHYSSTTTTKSRMPFLPISSTAHNNKNKTNTIVVNASSSSSSSSSSELMMMLKRTNSTTAPPSAPYLPSLNNTNTQDYTTHRRTGFWSFLHLSKFNQPKALTPANNTTPFVSKSRSVGCGSRSFTGDSTLRRVESTREGKRSSFVSRAAVERVRCGGLFGGGFNVTSSSSSSSDWVSNTGSITEEQRPDGPVGSGHGRSKSWGWSPMRAFGKPSGSRSGRREIGNGSEGTNNSRAAPNLAAIPSLLAVRG